MLQWLQNFNLRVGCGWWIVFAAGGFTLFIAFAIVTYQVNKVALSNPVDALRCE